MSLCKLLASFLDSLPLPIYSTTDLQNTVLVDLACPQGRVLNVGSGSKEGLGFLEWREEVYIVTSIYQLPVAKSTLCILAVA